MLAATALRQIFSNLRVTPALLAPAQTTTVQNRYIRIKEIPTPKPGGGKQYRRLVRGYVPIRFYCWVLITNKF